MNPIGTTAPFRWGLIGPGRIAHRFVDALRAVPGAQLVAVCGRDAEQPDGRTQAFARYAQQQQSGLAPRVHGSLDGLLQPGTLDAVYVATPHAQHGEAIRAALQAGIPVLCEKPLVPNAQEGAELVALAQTRRVFLMEALWSRFLPSFAQLAGLLRAGAIGQLQRIESRFCFEVPFDPGNRLYDPHRAGGAVLDIGIYNLAALRWVLQAAWGHCPEPEHLDVQGGLTPNGLDQWVQAQLHFRAAEQRVQADFLCALDRSDPNTLRITGTNGCIELRDGFWHAQALHLERGHPGTPDHVTQHLSCPWACNGFEYEIQAAQVAIRAGELEAPGMPHAESLALLRWMDTLRARLGVVYPFEAQASIPSTG